VGRGARGEEPARAGENAEAQAGEGRREREELGLGETLRPKERREARAGEKKRGREGPRGKKSWAAVAHAGGRGERGAGPRRGNGCPFFSFFFFPFLSYTQTNQTTHLNSNKFEFKPYKFHTRKIMLQHECTNNLIL
jgi:ribosomal protein L44E